MSTAQPEDLAAVLVILTEVRAWQMEQEIPAAWRAVLEEAASQGCREGCGHGGARGIAGGST
ncbi:MAG TPA: hypothetical protein VHU91_00470 [Mycobacteriales bacterium]|nr:hypothetical protein [Mycobacteriales bacterium]